MNWTIQKLIIHIEENEEYGRDDILTYLYAERDGDGE